ncbi:MAG: hypothetical protein WBE13_11525, partial [Candidatus Acidiferrum sp.]
LMEAPGSAEYLEHYSPVEDKDEHARLICQAIDTLYPDNDAQVTVGMLAQSLRTLIDSGKIKFTGEEEAPLEEPVIDERPRDKNGVVLNESQLRYREYRIWSEQASAAEVNLRKKSDPGYASYVRQALQAEMSATPVADGVENLNANRTRQSRGVAEDVRAFATRYRTMSVSDAKKMLSPGMNPDGPIAAKEANALFEAACVAGLI